MNRYQSSDLRCHGWFLFAACNENKDDNDFLRGVVLDSGWLRAFIQRCSKDCFCGFAIEVWPGTAAVLRAAQNSPTKHSAGFGLSGNTFALRAWRI